MLADRMPAALATEIDLFESQIALRRQGKIEEKVFAETRLRRGVYGQRYDNGQRNDGTGTKPLHYPDPWGVKVSAVEVKHVDLPLDMQRVIAKQAEAERAKRSKIIHAEGEFQASTQLAKAAEVIAKQPLAVTLRYLQTATEVAGDKNSTLIFPLPMDLLSVFMPKVKPGDDPGSK